MSLPGPTPTPAPEPTPPDSDRAWYLKNNVVAFPVSNFIEMLWKLPLVEINRQNITGNITVLYIIETHTYPDTHAHTVLLR